MLLAKKLNETATLPECAHPGEDLGFDIFTNEEVVLYTGGSSLVSTGIAAQFMAVRPVQGKLVGSVNYERIPYGLLIRDRSSMAGKGVIVSGGVIDAGYTGEIKIRLTNISGETVVLSGPRIVDGNRIPGDKIAQMIPIPVLTGAPVKEVEQLHESKRQDAGFGSTGV